MITWDAYPARGSAPPARVAGLAFDPAGRHLLTVPALRYDGMSTAASDPVTVWTAAGGRVRDFPSVGGAAAIATAAAFTPAGDRLVIAEQDRVNSPAISLGVWALATGERVHTSLVGSVVSDLKVLPDGTVLAAAGAFVRRYPADLSEDPAELRGRPRRPPRAYRVAVATGGAFLAGVSKVRATVWDGDGRPLAHRDHPKSPQNGPAAFRPHATALAVGHGTVVDIWDWVSGAEVVLKGHKRPVWAVGFSPDGGTAYTAASDGAVIAWDADTGAVRGRFDFGTGKLYSAAVSPDGLTLALGGDDGRVTVVDLDG